MNIVAIHKALYTTLVHFPIKRAAIALEYLALVVDKVLLGTISPISVMVFYSIILSVSMRALCVFCCSMKGQDKGVTAPNIIVGEFCEEVLELFNAFMISNHKAFEGIYREDLGRKL